MVNKALCLFTDLQGHYYQLMCHPDVSVHKISIHVMAS